MMQEIIINIIITMVVTIIISVPLALWQIKKNSIVHYSINSYDIGKGLSDEFPEFLLTYKGDALSNDVIVFKGCFMNRGRNDINTFKGTSDIKLIFPKDCILKAVTVSPSVEEMKVKATIDEFEGNIINFGIADFMGSGEFFKYTAIMEVEKYIKEIQNSISFYIRINDVKRKIHNKTIGPIALASRYRFFANIGLSAFVFLIFICIFGGISKLTGLDVNNNQYTTITLVLLFLSIVISFGGVYLFSYYRWKKERAIIKGIVHYK